MTQEVVGWQWYQLDHMQIICILLKTDPCQYIITQLNSGWMFFLALNQQHQNTEGNC